MPEPATSMPITPPPTGRLARALQIVLWVELSGMAIAGLWMWRSGWSVDRIAWALGGYYFGLRAFIVSKNFFDAERNRSPRAAEHQLGVFGALRLWWGEYWITQLTYSVLFPFERFLVPLAPVPAVPGPGTPIVLVPGFACNRGYWIFYVRALRRAGLGPVYAVSLEPLFGSIDANARQLGDFIEQVCQHSGASAVDLVGHSMGGLTIRAYLHGAGPCRVRRVVTLGTPHRGTKIAHPVSRVGENLRQMCLANPWAETLNAHEKSTCPASITAIVTPHDNIVFPQDSARLNYPNARNLVIPGIGHLEMVASMPVIRAVIEVLSAQPAAAPLRAASGVVNS